MNADLAVRGGVHALTAAVAGPALIWAGATYPGTRCAKAFLILSGAALIASHYVYFRSDLEKFTGATTT